MSGGEGAPKPIRHTLGTVTSAEGTRLSSSNRPDQAAKYGPGSGEGVQVEARTLSGVHIGQQVAVPEEDFHGRLAVLEHIVGGVTLILDIDDGTRLGHQLGLAPTDLVTLTDGGAR